MNKIISTNPAENYSEIGSIEVTPAEQVSQAVTDARTAFKSWRTCDLKERLSHIDSIRLELEKRLEEVATLQSKEMGKPIGESIGECKAVLHFLAWNIENAPRILAPRVLDELEHHNTELHLEPFGVFAAIAPWNYPAYQFFLAATQAIISGNTVVTKHSEECILTGKLLQDIVDSSTLPKHVWQSVYGAGETGTQLTDQDVDFIYFTGSSRTGNAIYRKAAEKCIPTLLEMGGSSPGVIFSDVDTDHCAKSSYFERFSNCGQICCALKRLIVHEDIHDELVEKLKSFTETRSVGNPLDKDSKVGPLAAERQLTLLEEQVKDAVEKGATVVTGGSRPEGLKGAYYLPTILTNVSKDMKVYKDEVFGPVLPIITFKTEEEAIELANDTEYGLSAFVYTNDTEQADRVSKALEAGQVSINGHSYFSDSTPFGGYKKSGIGRTDGEFGFWSVSQMKVIARPHK